MFYFFYKLCTHTFVVKFPFVSLDEAHNADCVSCYVPSAMNMNK